MPLDQNHVQPGLVGRAEYRHGLDRLRRRAGQTGLPLVLIGQRDLRLVRIDRVRGIGDKRGRQRGEERREQEPAAGGGEVL
jgi:hypothetical protein